MVPSSEPESSEGSDEHDDEAVSLGEGKGDGTARNVSTAAAVGSASSKTAAGAGGIPPVSPDPSRNPMSVLTPPSPTSPATPPPPLLLLLLPLPLLRPVAESALGSSLSLLMSLS
jgi:hypothetical protein